MTDAAFDRHFTRAVAAGVDPRHRDQYLELWERNRHLQGSTEGEQKLVEVAVAYSRRGWRARRRRAAPAKQPAGPMVFDAPAGLDDEGQRLHAEVQAFAAEHELDDWMSAFARTVGRHDLAPPTAETAEQLAEHFQTDQVDVEASADLEQRARALARQEDIHIFDAAGIVELDHQLDEAEEEQGYSSVEWLDTSSDLRPKPWRDDDYERDKRRAATFGMDLSRDEWQATAEEGRDLVFETATNLRAERLSGLEGRRAAELAAAKDREASRRRQAIEDELDTRARRRVGTDE